MTQIYLHANEPSEIMRGRKGRNRGRWRRGSEEKEEEEKPWNQMSRLSWKTKNNRIRNSTKLRQMTESWNPKDLKRKEIESEEGKKHKKKEEENGRNSWRRRRNWGNSRRKNSIGSTQTMESKEKMDQEIPQQKTHRKQKCQRRSKSPQKSLWLEVLKRKRNPRTSRRRFHRNKSKRIYVPCRGLEHLQDQRRCKTLMFNHKLCRGSISFVSQYLGFRVFVNYA